MAIVRCNFSHICKHKCGAKFSHDSRNCKPCPTYPGTAVKCEPIGEEKKMVKRIMFTLGDESEVHFPDLTGFPNPVTTDEKELRVMASAAMDTDNRIVSFRIVDLDPEELKKNDYKFVY